MKTTRNAFIRLLLATCTLTAHAGLYTQQTVVAILSSDLRPYQTAYAGFRQALGYEVKLIISEDHPVTLSSQTRVVLAFGGKASLYVYPRRVRLVYCMAPGVVVDQAHYDHPPIRIEMSPHPNRLLATMKQLQPNLRRLGVFWISDPMKLYVKALKAAGERHRITIVASSLASSEALPDALRASLEGGVDALWLPPDPMLISRDSFATLKEFSWSNAIPLYVPTAGLARQGALAAIGCNFRQVGETAAHVAQRLLQESMEAGVVYPKHYEVTVNLTVAQHLGLKNPHMGLKHSGDFLLEVIR